MENNSLFASLERAACGGERRTNVKGFESDIMPGGAFHKLLSSKEPKNGNSFEKPPTPAPKCRFFTCPGNQHWHNSHLGERRCLKARSEMPVGIWADVALGLGTFGLLSGFCHTKKKTVPMRRCSRNALGSAAMLWLAVCSHTTCAYTQAHGRGNKQTAESLARAPT